MGNALGGDFHLLSAARILFPVPRSAFRPVPGVDSAVVRVTPHAPPGLTEEDEARLRRLTRAAFQWRRKQMQKILRDHPDLQVPRDEVEAAPEAGELRRRPETFDPTELLTLARRYL